MIRDNFDAMAKPLPWQQQYPVQPHQMPPMETLPEQDEPDDEWAMTSIPYPGKHDVMLGRGGESNYHAGNLTFRTFIQEHKKRYQKARKQEKPIIALEVVLAWRDLEPPGRFLARIDPIRADSLWEDVGDDQACKRAGRTLGEKCSGKAAAKHQQRQKERQDKKTKPNATVSADAAISSTNTALCDSLVTSKLSPCSKRTQFAMDCIDTFKSREVTNKLVGDARTSPPPAKRRARSVSHDYIAAATQSRLCEQPPTLAHWNQPPLVTPYNPMNKVVNDDKKIRLDMGMILDSYDCPKQKDMAMRECLPTAEFLTQNVFFE